MLEIIVRLEESVAGEELDKDASNTPDVARKTPAKIEDDFRCAIVTSRDNGRMVLVVESCRSKINQSYLAVEQDSSCASIA